MPFVRGKGPGFGWLVSDAILAGRHPRSRGLRLALPRGRPAGLDFDLGDISPKTIFEQLLSERRRFIGEA